LTFIELTLCTELIVGAANSLSQLGAKEMERLIADFSGSAVLGFLVRILSNPSLITTETASESGVVLAQKLFRVALNWAACPTSTAHAVPVASAPVAKKATGAASTAITTDMVPEATRSVFYAMAGDRAGSYFLEALIECAPLDLLLSVVDSSVTGRTVEYVLDGSGNFVLQAVLRRLSCELPRAGKFASPEIEQLLTAVSTKLTEELVKSDNFNELVNCKGGVILWLLAVVQGLSDVSHSKVVGNKVIAAWIASGIESSVCTPANPSLGDAEAALLQQQNLSAVFSSKLMASAKVTADGSAAEGGGGGASNKKPNGGKGGKPAALANQPSADPRDTTQLLVARLIGALLRCRDTEVALLTAKAFAHITPEALKYVATSGAVSRAVMDVFFNVFAQTTEFKLLGINLAAIGVDLAQHYVGQHIVRQSFESADLRGKEKWAMTLSAASELLSRKKEGSGSLRLVNAELYMRDPSEWRSTVKRKLKAEAMLKELDGPAAATASGAGASGAKKAQQGTEQQQPAKQKTKLAHSTEDSSSSNKTKSAAPAEKAVRKVDNSDDEQDDNEDAGVAGGPGAGGGGGGGGRKRKRKRPGKSTNIASQASV
jgi:hypothetical protein